MTEKENVLIQNKHILICIDEQISDLNPSYGKELEYIKRNFCGVVFSNMDNFNEYMCLQDTIIYLCGNIGKIYENAKIRKNKVIFVIKEFSNNYEDTTENYKLINIGRVPINIHNVGVYFRENFNSEDYFNSIDSEHKFQTLTESNKPSNAFRTGIYLTKVEELNNELKFKLLRCSSNLNGPTDNFRTTDNKIVDRVNDICEYFFEEKTQLNHVLAQIYENKTIINDGKKIDRKAKIKDHSDKTKDMPRNGLIAFCTFYKNYSNDKFNGGELKHIKKSKDDSFDHCFNDNSVLTKIRFRLKKTTADPKLKNMFDVILYPNSVFIISLHMNRLYTHEIIPSILPIDKIPTRMGYVIRCSKTNAIFKDDQTYINENGTYIKMTDPDIDSIKELKDLYYKENTSDEIINYGKFYFSMNSGDYQKPII